LRAKDWRVVVATRLQELRRASRARRALAVVVSFSFVLSVVLASHHEATATHVVDPHTGQLRHADAIDGNHTGTQSDYHATGDGHSDNDLCALSAMLHQAARPSVGHAVALVSRAVLQVPATPRGVAFTYADIFRIAPKTSPPTRA